ncbi:MAG: UMP kinase [Thermoplasmata archaeon]|nr:UMP kinase [Thermoplasmata archaeon]
MPPARHSVPAPVVLSVGGSILRTGDGDVEYVRDLADLLRRLAPRFPLIVTTGGGRPAREYIEMGRSLGLTEVELDELGIEVTRLHARLLAALVGPPAPAHPPTTLTDAVRDAHRVSPVILGGTEPGHTTDGVAALMAARLRAARVVNATAVAGLYDKDPAVHREARRIPSMRWPAFLDLVHGRGRSVAGQNFVFDALGAEQLARARIPLLIVDGRDLPNLERALEGKSCVGTRID